MDASLLAVLNETERLLVAETEPAALAVLDEDAAIELETRIRRTRDKYVGQYRRAASARVAERGGRGRARPENARAAAKAEAFERALSRISRRVAALARQSAAALRAERLAAAKAARQGDWPGAGEMVPRQRRSARREPPSRRNPPATGPCAHRPARSSARARSRPAPARRRSGTASAPRRAKPRARAAGAGADGGGKPPSYEPPSYGPYPVPGGVPYPSGRRRPRLARLAVRGGEPVVHQRHDRGDEGRDQAVHHYGGDEAPPAERQRQQDRREHELADDQDQEHHHVGAEHSPAVPADRPPASAERVEGTRPPRARSTARSVTRTSAGSARE